MMNFAIFLLGALCVASTAVGAVVTVPLYVDGGYMWYAGVDVGTPPRRFNFTVDTGSSDFLLVGTGCPYDSCGVAPAEQYNASASSSAQPLTCDAAARAGLQCATCVGATRLCGSNVTYGGNIEESFALVRDVATVVGGPGARTVVGDTYAINMGPQAVAAQRLRTRRALLRSKLRDSGVPDPSGMWGLASKSLVSAGYAPFFDSLVAASAGALADRFAVALTPTGGKMTLGGSITPPEGFSYVPRALPEDFYRVEISDVTVGGVSLGLPPATYNDPGIVDTGTPTPTVPQAAFDALVRLIRSRCSGPNATALHGVCDVAPNASVLLGGCFDFTDDQVEAFPTISFKLPASGVLAAMLEYRPQAYLIPQYYCESPTQRSFALQADAHFTVLGASLLQQYEVLFDRAGRRIGFAANPLGQP